MKCLYCGKLIAEGASIEEKTWRWHKRCIRSFLVRTKCPVWIYLKTTDRRVSIHAGI